MWNKTQQLIASILLNKFFVNIEFYNETTGEERDWDSPVAEKALGDSQMFLIWSRFP